MKKILSILLCLAMVLSLTVMASAAETTTGEYAIVAEYEGKTYAMTTELNADGNKLIGVEVTVTDGVVSGNVPTWTVTTVDGGVTLSNANGYLTHPSSTAVEYSTEAKVWGLEGKDDGKVWLTDGNRAIALRFYQNNYIFGAYASSNAGSSKYGAEYSYDLQLLPVNGSAPVEPPVDDPVTPPVSGGDEPPVTGGTDVPPASIENGTYAIVANLDGKFYAMGNELDANGNKFMGYEVTVTDGVASGTIVPAWTVTVVDGGVTLSNAKGYAMHPEKTNVAYSADPVVWGVEDLGDGAYHIISSADTTRAIAFRSFNGGFIFGSYALANLTNGYGAGYSYSLFLCAVGTSTDVEKPVEPPVEEPPVPAPSDPKEIVDAAFKLAENESLPYEATLTGSIIRIDTEWAEKYDNITVTIEVEGSDGKHELMCYRLKGGAELKVGDVITVTGTIKNYKGTVEFDKNCTYVPAADAPVDPPITETGDPIAVVMALLAAASLGIVVIGKKKF